MGVGSRRLNYVSHLLRDHHRHDSFGTRKNKSDAVRTKSARFLRFYVGLVLALLVRKWMPLNMHDPFGFRFSLRKRSLHLFCSAILEQWMARL